MNENRQERTISAKQEKTIKAVLESKNITQGLQEANTSRAQFYTWMRDDEVFRAELERRRKELTEEGYHLLKLSVQEAASTMLKLLEDAKDEAVRLRAANSILERVEKISELEDIERRLTELEMELKK